MSVDHLLEALQKRFFQLLKDIGWLNESMFCYKEIYKHASQHSFGKNFFAINIVDQYHFSMILSACRQCELLINLLHKIALHGVRLKSEKEKIDDIPSDIEQLKKVLMPIKIVRDKVVAHIDYPKRPIGATPFKQLEKAIILISEIAKKYDELIGLNKYSRFIPENDLRREEFLRDEGEYRIFEC